LLKQIGIPFRAMTSHVHEEVDVGDPMNASCTLAQRKAAAIHPKSPGSWVLGADTVVAVDAVLLGKPGNAPEAAAMLQRLQGKEHVVITGYCILSPSGEVAHREAVSTTVRFKNLSEQEIASYIATGEPFGKAGSYAIQGIGAFLVEEVSGSYTNVVGLPLCALVNALLAVGALKTFPLAASTPPLGEKTRP
jgi:septum formation protein